MSKYDKTAYMIFDTKNNEPWWVYVNDTPTRVKEEFVYCSNEVYFDSMPLKKDKESAWKDGWKEAKKLGFRCKKLTYKNNKIEISEKNY